MVRPLIMPASSELSPKSAAASLPVSLFECRFASSTCIFPHPIFNQNNSELRPNKTHLNSCPSLSHFYIPPSFLLAWLVALQLLVKMIGRWQVIYAVVALLVVGGLGQQAELIDFTYSHVLPEVGGSGDRQGGFNIQPAFKSAEKLEFPLICELKERLDQEDKDGEGKGTAGDSESDIEYLRERILQLLKLAEDIKAHRSMVEGIELEYRLKEEQGNRSHFEQDLKRLEDRQALLAQQKARINQLSGQINALLDVYRNSPKGQQLSHIGIQYDIAFAESKVAHYEKLRDELHQLQAVRKPFNYEIFFSNLNSSFERMHGQLADIDELIGNHTYRARLRESVGNLRNKIEIDRLTLNEKRNCNHSKSNIRSRAHITEEIRRIFQDLRAKKKEFKGMNNTHCEGVAKKLDEKIRNWLKIINRAYICSEGLEAVERALADKEADLSRMEEELAGLEVGRLEVYQRNYQRTVDEIGEDIGTMRDFRVDEYRHSILHIQQLIQRSKGQAARAREQLRALPIGSGETISFPDLEKLVEQVKREKAAYCREYEAYEELNRQAQVRLQAYEKAEMERAHARSQYFKYGERVLALQEQYANLTREVLSKLASPDQ